MTSSYVLERDEGQLFGTKRAYADQAAPVNIGSFATCLVCGGPVSMREWLPPHRIKLASAKPEKWGDFVWGAGFGLMVSDRFKVLYEAEGLTGITKFWPPAEIVGAGHRKKRDLPNPLPSYSLLEILWNGANQDDVASGYVPERPEEARCTFCHLGGGRSKQKGIVIEEGSWKGADIFGARGAPVREIVSERFKQVVEAHRLKNAWFIPAEKYAWDVNRRGLWYVRE